MFDFESFSNSTLKKVFKGLADKGTAALSDEKFKQVRESSLMFTVVVAVKSAAS